MDIPQDFKIEHDRLVYQAETPLKRLAEIILELGGVRETIEYNGFKIKIEVENERD